MDFYTARESSLKLEVSKVTVFRWIKSGRLKAVKETSGKGGGEYKIYASSVDQLSEIISKKPRLSSDKKHKPIQKNLNFTPLEDKNTGPFSPFAQSINAQLKRIAQAIEHQNNISERLAIEHQNNISERLAKALEQSNHPKNSPPRAKQEIAHHTKNNFPPSDRAPVEKEINWIDLREKLSKEHAQVGSYSGLAQKIGMSVDSLRKFISGKRKRVGKDSLKKIETYLQK